MAEATHSAVKCPRCGLGVDDNGDGDCAICARLSDRQVEDAKMLRPEEIHRVLFVHGERESV